MQWFWLSCLTIAAISDIKRRTVSCGVLAVCGILGVAYAAVTGLACHIQGLAIGAGILLMSRITQGAIGEGDGWFFVVSSWYLDEKEVWVLLLGSLSVSWCWSAGLILYRVWCGRNAGKATIPFLACMWLAGVWILLQKEGFAWLSPITVKSGQ